MRTLAPDVHQLRGFAPHAINTYLVGDVLVDAGTPLAKRRILRQLNGHQVNKHVVTHGHIALWRESDGVLVCGDVFFNLRRLGPPPNLLTVDPEVNRSSMRRLAELRPALVLFGHGRPLRDPDGLARAVRRSAKA